MKKNDIVKNIAVIMLMIVILIPLSGCGNSKKSDNKSVSGEYLIKEQNGAVFVFENGEAIKRTDIVISSLPKSEMLELEKGITAYSYEEVERLIELYES